MESVDNSFVFCDFALLRSAYMQVRTAFTPLVLIIRWSWVRAPPAPHNASAAVCASGAGGVAIGGYIDGFMYIGPARRGVGREFEGATYTPPAA